MIVNRTVNDPNGSDKMIVGIDFDNTIACYDAVFEEIAKALNLIEPDLSNLTKKKVRDLVKARPEGENDWVQLQSAVYGRYMHAASLTSGFEKFVSRCHQRSALIYIVSHKTEFGHADPQKINLRQAALKWMESNGFFTSDRLGLSRENVYFEKTRTLKIRRITELRCTHFIDDLEEVLREPDFPVNTRRLLYAGNVATIPSGPFEAFRSWRDIGDAIFGACA